MEKKGYSDDIANAISSFLKEDDWKFDFDDEKGVFKFSLSLKSKIKRINYVISVKKEEYSVYAVSPIEADENDKKIMANMSEFICRINYGLRMGNFELDHRDGEIRYKVNICCSDMIPTKRIISRSIYCPATMFEHYGSGIINIIFSDATAKNAFEKCKKSVEDASHHGVSTIASSENGNSTDVADTMMARLAARLGSSSAESSQDSEQTGSNLSEPIIHTDLFRKKGGVS